MPLKIILLGDHNRSVKSITAEKEHSGTLEPCYTVSKQARRFFDYYRVTALHYQGIPNALSLNLNRVLNSKCRLP